MSLLLAGDIGGTKTILSLWSDEGDQLRCVHQQQHPSEQWSDLAPLVRHVLSGARQQGLAWPRAACFAVAGPVQGGRARLTNLPWRLEQSTLARECELERLELINDFAVLVHGLPHLGPDQTAVLRPGSALPDEPLLVLGAGTGLGVALGVPEVDGLRALATEASHAEFAAHSPQEWALREWMRSDLGLERVSIERVVSGTGLGHVARWLLATRPEWRQHPLQELGTLATGSAEAHDKAKADLPAAVAAAAASGDPMARTALDLWLRAYGSVCGDLALASLPRGGIWLAGGTAAKLLEELRGPLFEQGFLDKGRMKVVLDPLPITAITDPAAGAFSAAQRAKRLL
ncbi:MAG: glucokinase [Synechococcaceae cyanobacterium]|nr:glucokinase [Synechococcaceae cyanobacterium]